MLQLTIFEIFTVKGPKFWICGVPQIALVALPPKGEKTCLGLMCTIMQNFSQSVPLSPRYL